MDKPLIIIYNFPCIDVPNILIITQHEQEYTNGNDEYDENSFDLITSQFVGRFNNTSAILLDTFYGRNTTFKQNANLFPDKLSNLEQRVVRLALFNYNPYSIWKEVVSVCSTVVCTYIYNVRTYNEHYVYMDK